ncbi:MAG: UPF0175 family protein [Hormoscilla sp. SP5CHS1]|nr:UPF0175 family protein [Hormoscilla sp. SP5CHS1]
MTLLVPTLSLSTGLNQELAALTETGLYDSQEAFLTDAVRTFLAARPDLREAIACKLYERGVFSLGRAAEWSGLNIEAMKQALERWGVVREAFETWAQIEAMAHKTLTAAGRWPK